MYSLLVGGVIGVLTLAVTLGSVPGALLSAVVTALLYYVCLPVLAPDFVGIWALTVIGLFIGTVVSLLTSSTRTGAGTGATATAVLVTAIGVSAFVTSAPMLNAHRYQALLGTVTTVPFEEAVQRLDTSGSGHASGTVLDQANVMLVDEHIALRRAQELLGADHSIGGSFALGPFSKTRLNGSGAVVWAAELDFTGLGAWFSSDGAPGYVWVDAHDARKAGYVNTVKGKPIRLRCTPNAWFSDQLHRSMTTSGYASEGLEDFSFEIGPDGRPLYVVTRIRHAVGFSGDDTNGVVVFDPQDCSGQKYAMADVPSWVNRVVPEYVVAEQVTDWGLYGKGWLNAAFGGKSGVTKPTLDGNGRGVELVPTARNGVTAWYVGITSPSRSTGTMGFVLIDSRTKKVTYFEQAGATEWRAQAAILGKVSQMSGWNAGLPILYNIFGRPTYLAILKDASGNFKQVGLVPVDDTNLVVTADTLPRALEAYSQSLAGQSNPGEVGIGSTVSILEGVISRIASEVVDGKTIYYIMLAGEKMQVVSATNRIGPQVALARPGDTVKMSVTNNLGNALTARSLSGDNLPGTP